MTATSVERANGTPLPVEPRFEYDPVAHAEAEAIRTRATAEADALRIEAEGKAKAAETLAAEQAEKDRLENDKQRVANDRAALRFKREEAEQLAKIAKADADREETERAAEAARRQAEEQQQADEQAAAEVDAAETKWRHMALGFYTVCAIVALPVQVAAFYNPHAIWLMAAPLMLEGGAWVVLKGAAAAVAAHRPHWHYRLIAWLLAFIAACINLWHGLNAFDPATAIGTAFASIAGPGVWDLHEHGRIRKRDGALTRRERRAQRKAEQAETARKAAEEKQRTAEKESADKAAAEEAQLLSERRANQFPKVWEHAEKLATDLGLTTVTQAVWEQAKLDVEGAKPGESAEVLRMRNAAAARVEAARQSKPVSTVSKTTNAQRANQMPRAQRGPARKPPTRQAGDTQQYVAAARRQASIAAKTARPSND